MQGVRGDDLGDFYDAGLGPTRSLAVDATGVFSSDADGPLAPGRYLFQVTDPGGSDVVWFKLIPYKTGETPTMNAAPPAFPFAQAKAIEVNVRPGHNDRVVARTTGAATATLYMTQISRVPQKR